MKLIEMEIEGFRSIDNLFIDLTNFCALVGENSSGKSTILQSIDILLNDRTRIDDLDFHQSRGKKAEKIRIKGKFSDLIDKEKSNLATLFGPPFNEVIIEKVIEPTKSRTSTSTYVEVPQAKNKLLNSDYISGSTKSEYQDAVDKGELPEWILGPDRKGNVGDLRKQIPKYVEQHSSDIDWSGTSKIEIKGSDLQDLHQILPEPLYVPAFDDISNHVAPKSRNILGKLLNHIFDELESAKNPDMMRLNNIMNNLTKKFRHTTRSDNRFDSIKHLEQELSKHVKSVMPNSEAKLVFEQPSLKDILMDQFELKLDDGVTTPVENKGHGAQRTMIWALLRVYLDELSGKGDSNVVFLVEEPELYLHPQAQRVMLGVLRRLAENEQVIYSTHSSVFVDLSHPEEIRLIRKNFGRTVICSISDETLEYKKNEVRFKTWVDNERAELFFAKSVIIIEGETEKILLQDMNIEDGHFQLDELGCQVLSVGGKFSMPFYTSLLNDIETPYFVIYDQDSSTGKHEEINNHIEKNIRLAKSRNITVKKHVFRPYLEKDWELNNEEEQKPQEMHQQIMEWNEKNTYPSQYENLKNEIFSFANKV